jgi:NAD(P)H-dependent FMN reductase
MRHIEYRRVAMMAAPQTRNAFPDFIIVLVLVGLPAGPISRALSRHAVVALRTAASEADAVLVVTSYRGRVPSMVHSAIDWLTRRWRHGALHDKPLAVVGRSAGCYSGVWSRQVEDTRGGLGPRVIESMTAPTLREAVEKLADEVRGGTAAAAM